MTGNPARRSAAARALTTIRPATVEDVGAVGSLAHAAYRRYVGRVGREPEPMSSDYAALVGAGRVRVAVDGERVLGYVVVVPQASHLLVENLAVAPEEQGRGVGGQLLLDAEAYAVSLGHTEVRLFTHEAMTENLAYYPRQGYVETHRATEDGFPRVFFSKRV